MQQTLSLYSKSKYAKKVRVISRFTLGCGDDEIFHRSSVRFPSKLSELGEEHG